MSESIVVLGAGYFAVEVTDLIREIRDIHVVGYFINDPNGRVLLKPILNEVHYPAIGAIISPKRRTLIESLNCEFTYIIHPSASVSWTVGISEGVIINRLVAISAYAKIGKHTIINRCASIGHHVEIGDFCTIGPGVNIAGNVQIQEGVTVGMGANILEGRKIGKDSIVGAGAVVTKDVPSGVKAMGIPAKWTFQ